MSSSLMPEAITGYISVCSCDKWMRTICYGEASYKTPEGKTYCVLHYPCNDKSAAFREALNEKIKTEDFDFRGVWFPDIAEFDGVIFTRNANLTSLRSARWRTSATPHSP